MQLRRKVVHVVTGVIGPKPLIHTDRNEEVRLR